MKKNDYEYIQRIKSEYVKDDCVQIMIPYLSSSGVTILNSDGITYHYSYNSADFVNKYVSDKRKEGLKYSKILNHRRMIKFEKIEYVNQLLDFNRIYIKISSEIITEYYAIKDGDEALLAIKHMIPYKSFDKYMNKEELVNLIKNANGLLILPTGEYYDGDIEEVFNEESIVNMYRYKQSLTLEDEEHSKLTEITIDDIPSGFTLLIDNIITSISDNEINKVRLIDIKFLGPDNFKIEQYFFPITFYSLEYLKKLEKTNYKKTPEPKISRFLNRNINKEELKKAKSLVLKNK